MLGMVSGTSSRCGTIVLRMLVLPGSRSNEMKECNQLDWIHVLQCYHSKLMYLKMHAVVECNISKEEGVAQHVLPLSYQPGTSCKVHHRPPFGLDVIPPADN